MDKQNPQDFRSVRSSPPARVTRSSARNTSASSNPTTNNLAPLLPPPPPPSRTNTRKRKASTQDQSINSNSPSEISQRKRTKSSKADTRVPPPPPEPPKSKHKSKPTLDMSNSDTPSAPTDEPNLSSVLALASSSSSKRKPSRKRSGNDPATTSSTATAPSRTTKKSSTIKRSTEKTDPTQNNGDEDDVERTDSDENNDQFPRGSEEMEEDEDFSRQWTLGSGSSRLESAMQRIHGAITRTMTELRTILENLKQRSDPTLQRLALEELAHVLLMANEDTLAGHFSPEPYIREIVPMMRSNDFGDENPEMMLMACRCLANMMEALPSSTGSIVYSGAVPILCQKLMEIHYIDVAEQALSTLEKISVEFPGAIVREGGLSGCLMYLDFFATSTQRTAVTTAANCCRNIPEDALPTVVEVMPILLGVLSNSDQKVLEQGCLCVSRIVESFKYHDSKLEMLVSEDLLKAILRLLVPGTTNLIGPKIHTSFLRVLAFAARASPKRSVALIKMNVVDTLYQILTGVSPPSGTDGEVATKIDKVMIMQALIHRPRDQIYETLNVICELLPNVTTEGLHYLDGLFDAGYPGPDIMSIAQLSRNTGSDDRTKLLGECQKELRRFAVILFPTLTDAYSSTVNLSVRQKVLTAQLKMLSNIDVAILEEALLNVSYSSFLATILSQGDHSTLVTFALQAAEVLLKRLESIYRPQFYREGVFAEIGKLTARPLKSPTAQPIQPSADEASNVASIVSADLSIGSSTVESFMDETNNQNRNIEGGANDTIGDLEMEFHDGNAEDDDDDSQEDDDDSHDEENEGHDPDEDDEVHGIEHEQDSDDSESTSEEDYVVRGVPSSLPDPEDLITMRAQKFMQLYDNDDGSSMRTQATTMLQSLQGLTTDISQCYAANKKTDGLKQFQKLAAYFSQDPLSSVTSYEILSSKIVETLLNVISEENPRAADSRASFLQAFMGQGTQTKEITATSASPATPFSMLVHKLQDLLSREEHFEVMTVHQNSYDSGRSNSASVLAKQIRIKLLADDDSVPEPFRQTVVTVHALATIKSLAEFLRPRISMPDRASRLRRDLLPHGAYALQQYAAALAGRQSGHPGGMPPLPVPGELSSRTIPKRSDRSEHAEKANATKSTASTSQRPTTESPAANTNQSPSPGLRRSRRRQGQSIAPPPPPPAANNQEQAPVECADEQPISDGENISDREAFNRILNRLGDRLGERIGDRVPGQTGEEVETEEEDPSAVNLEVAAGGKVIARKEDGTRIATPVSSQKTSRSVSTPRPSGSANRTAFTPSRSLSYAAAMLSTPQDWHLEFSVNGQPISPDTTVYRVVHFSQPQSNEVSARTLLQNTHTIKFKKVDGPPPADTNALVAGVSIAHKNDGRLPSSLSRHPVTASILQLLRLLHSLNSNIDDVLAADKEVGKLIAEPLSQFVNTKLTAKLNRQLEEPLIVASGCLPTWSEDLARLYPFLFPFETRHLFLQSTSFGFARSITRWQNDQFTESRNGRLRDDRHHFLGRLQRQKVRISRNRMLESCVKVMDLYGHSAAILEVEFFDEVGTGLGPTLEFYSTVSKQFALKSLHLWRENDASDKSEYAFSSRGLFPAPMSPAIMNSDNGKKALALYKTLGKFVARSMLDSRIIDISFNPTFFRIGLAACAVLPSLGAVESVDESLARSLRLLRKAVVQKKVIENDEILSDWQKAEALADVTVGGISVEDLSLDFTLPGYPDIELKPDGANIGVTILNLEDYIDKVMEFTLGEGVRRQVVAFQEGFSQVFPYAALQAFTPDELVMLFGRVNEDWSLETLMDSIKADHGYNLDSKSVRNLLQTMSSFTLQERREFLQFVTGSPKLPIGGFKALTPMFTVVCKPSEPPYTSDDYLPSVMTCVNYLKLPDYTTAEFMRKKLDTAMKEGQGAFHLS